MGLLFQPYEHSDDVAYPADQPSLSSLATTVRLAITAQLVGNVGESAQLFTADVVCRTPRLRIDSLAELASVCDDGEDALTNLSVTFASIRVWRGSGCAEWLLEAEFSGPLLVQDDVLVEPTGRCVRLRGATFVEFRAGRICDSRHYFDDNELIALAELPRTLL